MLRGSCGCHEQQNENTPSLRCVRREPSFRKQPVVCHLSPKGSSLWVIFLTGAWLHWREEAHVKIKRNRIFPFLTPWSAIVFRHKWRTGFWQIYRIYVYLFLRMVFYNYLIIYGEWLNKSLRFLIHVDLQWLEENHINYF